MSNARLSDLLSSTDPVLKDAIEWEYRQSVKHLRGWDPLAI